MHFYPTLALRFFTGKKLLWSLALLLPAMFIHAQPVVTSFTPASGPVGTNVTISGANFSVNPANNKVFFGATRAAVITASSTSLTVTAPYGATYQPISVLHAGTGLTGYSNQPYKVTFAGVGNITPSAFETAPALSSPFAVTGLSISDFDGDGKSDLVTNNPPVRFFRNTTTNNQMSFASGEMFDGEMDAVASACSDMDGDGKPDLVFVSNTFGFSVYRNTSAPGTITFTSKQNFATNANPKGIVIADIDGDGKPDLLTASSSGNSFSVLRNTSLPGNISFAAKVDFTTASAAYDLVAGDFDNDGKKDIAVSNYNSNSISIFRNISTPGAAAFSPKFDLTTGTHPYGLSVGDIDNDSKADICVANEGSSSLSVFLNTSAGGIVSFGAKQDLAVPGGTTFVAIADLDGDGKLELTVPDASNGQVLVRKNNSTPGSISFANAIGFTVASNPQWFSLGDLDNDGKPDIASAHYAFNGISVLRNKVNDPFINSFSPTNGPAGTNVSINGYNFLGTTAVSFGGKPAASFQVNSATNITAVVGAGSTGVVRVATAYGAHSKESFIYPKPFITSVTPLSAIPGATVTINGGNFNTMPDSSLVLFGSVKGQVTEISPTTIKVKAPINGSYKPVIVFDKASGLRGSSVHPVMPALPGYAGLPQSIFASNHFIAGAIHYPVAADLNNDGFLDLTIAVNGYIKLYRSNAIPGNLGFGAPHQIAVGQDFQDMSLADINNDGKPDLVLSTNPLTNYPFKLKIFINTTLTGEISFAAPVEIPLSEDFDVLRTADMDNDGKFDIVIGSYQHSKVGVLLNKTSFGNVQFTDPYIISVQSSPLATASVLSMAIGDFDGDSKPDVALCSYGNSRVTVLPNTSAGIGDISFGPMQDFATESPVQSVLAGDIDGDNRLDLIATRDSSFVSVFRNFSTGPGVIAFGAPLDFETGKGAVQQALSDIDGDGKVDIATSNYTGRSVSLLRNVSEPGDIFFNDKVDFAIPARGGDIALADFDTDSLQDLVVLNAAPEGGAYFYKNTLKKAPFIYSFSPTTGGHSDTINIQGRNFFNVDSVSFGGVKADTVIVVSNSLIKAVPGWGLSGKVAVRTIDGFDSKNGFTHVGAYISSFSPTAGDSGTIVTIQGYNFTGTTAVSFGDVPAVSFNVQSANTILAKVGGGASGTVKVTTPLGFDARNGYKYPGPMISGFAPSKGPVGSVITIYGTNFHPIANRNFVYFGAVKGEVLAATTTALNVKVPGGTSFQRLSVTTNNLVAFAQKPFITTFSQGGFIDGRSFALPKSYYAKQPVSIVSGDLDGDGIPELLVSIINTSYMGLYNANADSGELHLLDSIYAPSLYARTYLADLDGDGRLDVIRDSILRNTSSPGVFSFVRSQAGFNSPTLGFIDFNFDGKTDVVAKYPNEPKTKVFQNKSEPGNISFEPALELLTTGESWLPIPVTADVNGDALPDIVIANQAEHSISIFQNTSVDSILSFAAKQDIAVATTPTGIAAGDLDGDGDNDLVLSSFDINSPLLVLKKTSTNGQIGFEQKASFANIQTFRVALSDMDGDGKPDIVAGKSGVLKNTTNNDSLSFARLVPVNINAESALEVADMDLDGKPDIAGGVGLGAFTYTKNTVGLLGIGQTCAGGNIEFKSNISGAGYQWQLKTDTGFANLLDTGRYSGTSTPLLHINNVPDSMTGRQYRCKVGNNYSNVFTIAILNNWTGAVSNDWFNSLNWSCGVIPNAQSSVIINAGTVIINAGTAVYSLTVAPGVHLKITPGAIMTLTGK